MPSTWISLTQTENFETCLTNILFEHHHTSFNRFQQQSQAIQLSEEIDEQENCKAIPDSV
jgi:hypothetical protein